MIFVVSTGRSGTRSLAEFLNHIDGIRAFHQPEPLFQKEIAGFVRGEIDVDTLAAKLRETRPETLDGQEYAESNPVLSCAIPCILKAFPKSRFIWLVRDGREVISSVLRRGGVYGGPDASGNEWRDNRIRADWIGEMSTSEWRALSEFERCCWYWTEVNRVIGEGLAHVPPDRNILLHLEFLEQEKDTLGRRFGLHIPPSLHASIYNQSLLRSSHNWPSWSAGQRSAFLRTCGGMMDRLYPDWRDGSGVWRPIHRFRGRVRLWLGIQELARRMVFGRNPASRVLRAALQRLPGKSKKRLHRAAGQLW